MMRKGSFFRAIISCLFVIFAFSSVSMNAMAEDRAMMSPRLTSLDHELETGNAAALTAFWGEMKDKVPLVETLPGDEHRRIVTFLWRGDGTTTSVSLIGGIPSANIAKPMTRLGESDLWYLTETHPADARFQYAFQTNAPSEPEMTNRGIMTAFQSHPPQLDPLNPLQYAGQSYVELPEAPPQPWIKSRPDVPHGTMTDQNFKSAVLSAEYPLTIYLPPGYEKEKRRCWLLIAFDGGFPEMETTLDNLRAGGKIPPLVVVGVHNIGQEARDRDLGGSDAFAGFLANELVPWARKNYRVYADPSHTIVGGVSLGGFMAIYCGLTRSNVFGKILALSPTLIIAPKQSDPNPVWEEEAPGMLPRRFAENRRLPLKFYLEAGRYEAYLPFSILTQTRRLRDVLIAKGYPVTYHESVSGHNSVSWRGSFADAAMALTASRKR